MSHENKGLFPKGCQLFLPLRGWFFQTQNSQVSIYSEIFNVYVRWPYWCGQGRCRGVRHTSFHWDFELICLNAACPSLGGHTEGGGGGRRLMKPVSQCCLNIVDNSVKFLFMNISV